MMVKCPQQLYVFVAAEGYIALLANISTNFQGWLTLPRFFRARNYETGKLIWRCMSNPVKSLADPLENCPQLNQKVLVHSVFLFLWL